MGRIRTIKPEFPQSETIGALSRDARLLFIQLWTVVDDAGRTRAAPRLLAGWLYPYDDDASVMMDDWLAELEEAALVRRYRVGGTMLLDIPTWSKHQKIDRPSASKLPPFAEGSRILANPREAFRPISQGASGASETAESKDAQPAGTEPAADGTFPQPVENKQFDESSRALASPREPSMLDLGPRTLDHSTSSLRSDGAGAPPADRRDVQRGDGPRRRNQPAADSPQAQALTALLAETVTGLPSGSDDTPQGRLWREGLTTLARLSGRPAKKLRSLLGRMRDDLAAAPGIDDPESALLGIIDRADTEQPSDPIPWIAGAIRSRCRSPSPCANDDAEAWSDLADKIETDRNGRKRPVANGYYLDVYARDVCAAAGFSQAWRGDWSPLVAWLRDDLDGDGKPNIVNAIRRVASRPGYQPPASLAYFDAAVRGPRPAAVA